MLFSVVIEVFQSLGERVYRLSTSASSNSPSSVVEQDKELIYHLTKTRVGVQITPETNQHVKWSTKTGHRLEFFQYRFSDSFGGNPPLYSAVLVRCNIQRYSPLWRELPPEAYVTHHRHPFVLQTPEEVSIGLLSQQFPRRLILCLIWYATITAGTACSYNDCPDRCGNHPARLTTGFPCHFQRFHGELLSGENDMAQPTGFLANRSRQRRGTPSAYPSRYRSHHRTNLIWLGHGELPFKVVRDSNMSWPPRLYRWVGCWQLTSPSSSWACQQASVPSGSLSGLPLCDASCSGRTVADAM